MNTIAPTVNYGGSSVILWGYFVNKEKEDLKKLDGILIKDYHQILCKHAVS